MNHHILTMAERNVREGGEYSLYLWGDDATVVKNSKIYDGDNDDGGEDDDGSKYQYKCNYTGPLYADGHNDPTINVTFCPDRGGHLQHPLQSHRDTTGQILSDHVHSPTRHTFQNLQELIEHWCNTRKFSSHSQQQDQPPTPSRLASCLSEYSNEPIKMLHLRDIHTIDHDLDISAIHRFLINNPTCRKVWIEDCDMQQQEAVVATAGAASSATDADTTVPVPSLSPLIRTILSVRKPTIDDHCQCRCCGIVEELIIEGPNITNTCLDAILESCNMTYTSCCSVDTSDNFIADCAGGLKRLVIDKWLTTKKDPDEPGASGLTEVATISLPCLPTTFPYQLIRRLSEVSKGAGLGGLTHVTLRGLKLLEINDEHGCDRDDDEQRIWKGNSEDWDGSTDITHWDVSECIFHDINDGNYSNMYRNDPTYFLRHIKSHCPSLRSLRMDSNDIVCMMNACHNRIVNDVDGDLVIDEVDDTDHQTSPTDTSCPTGRDECPLLTDFLALPTLNTLELCWELPPPLLRGGDATLRTIALQDIPGGMIEYDVISRDNFFLSEHFYERMLRSWNTSLSMQDEDVDSKLLSHLARGIGASLESSYSRRMIYGSKISGVGDVENSCASIEGLEKLKLNRNTWSTRDLRTLFCTSFCPSVVHPSLSSLQELGLTCCGIDGTSFLYLICNVLCQLKNLQSLDIGYNPNILHYHDGSTWSSNGLSDQQSIYYSVLEFVRSHPRLTFLSLEGIRHFPKKLRDELLYILSIKRCGCPPPAHIHSTKGSVSDKKATPQIQIAAALWPLVLDHSRFLEFNDMEMSRKNDDSIRAQSQAIYYVLNEAILTL